MQCSHGPCHHLHSDLTVLDHHSHPACCQCSMPSMNFQHFNPQPVLENAQHPTSRGSHLCRTQIFSTLNSHHSTQPGADDRRHLHKHHLIAIMKPDNPACDISQKRHSTDFETVLLDWDGSVHPISTHGKAGSLSKRSVLPRQRLAPIKPHPSSTNRNSSSLVKLVHRATTSIPSHISASI